MKNIIIIPALVLSLGLSSCIKDYTGVTCDGSLEDCNSGYWAGGGGFSEVLYGTGSDDHAAGTATDSSGNIYVAGYTSGAFSGETNLGGRDIFIAKFDSDGDRAWIKQYGSTADDYATGIAIDTSNNIYVTGYSYGDFNGETNQGGYDIILLRLDSNGFDVWTVEYGTTAEDKAYAIAIDSAGKIYLTGYTDGDMKGTNAGGSDYFVLRYDDAITFTQWQWGTTVTDVATGITVDGSGNFFVTGYTDGELTLGDNLAGHDLFAAQYDSTGTEVWLNQMGTSDDVIPYGIALDTGGNIYVTGSAQGNLDSQTNSGGEDIMLVKYNSSGTKQWTKLYGTASDDFANSIDTDSSGNVYLVGETGGDYQGDGNAGQTDVFVAQYDSSGTNQWIEQVGTTLDDTANCVFVDSSDNIFVAGESRGDFGGLTNTNSGSYDFFLISFETNGDRR